MWELPSLEKDQFLTSEEWQEQLQKEYGFRLEWEKQPWMTTQHTFSHLQWHLDIFKVDERFLPKDFPDHWQWTPKTVVNKLSFPKAYKQVIEKIHFY